MAQTEDYYSLLGVSPSATPGELTQAYAAQVAASAADPQRVLTLSQAFQVLVDPQQRAQYDQSRGPLAPGAAAAAGVPAAGVPAAEGPAPATPFGGGPAGGGPAPTVLPGSSIASGMSGAAPAAGNYVPSATVMPGAPLDVPPGATLREGVPSPGFPSPGFPTGMPSTLEDRTVLTQPGGIAPLPEDVTVRPASITCPVCSTVNYTAGPAGAYCQDCGFLLSQTPGEAPAAAAGGVRLVASTGDREFLLREGINTVGRHDADVLLPDGTVSRLHARLHLSGDRLEVEDSNSTNGTRVNGGRLEPGQRTPVSDGDELQFGSIAVRVKDAASSGRSPAGPSVNPDSTIMVSPEAAPASTAQEAARLVSMGSGEVYVIYQFPATVGRRADNPIVINDPYVSGRHAEIFEQDGGTWVKDLGSTNGTIVGAEPLAAGATVPLEPDGIVQFGKQRFRFVLSQHGLSQQAPAESAGQTPGETESLHPGAASAEAIPAAGAVNLESGAGNPEAPAVGAAQPAGEGITQHGPAAASGESITPGEPAAE